MLRITVDRVEREDLLVRHTTKKVDQQGQIISWVKQDEVVTT